MVLHLWEASRTAPIPVAITRFALLNSIYFNKINSEHFEKNIIFKSIRNGKANCIYLKSKTFLEGNANLSETESVNAPVIIPIPQIEVKKGQNVRFKIKYKFGGGFGSFSAVNLK
jgi:predicted RNA methylase